MELFSALALFRRYTYSYCVDGIGNRFKIGASLSLAQEWRVEPPLISPVLLEKLRGYGGILITPNRGRMAYLLF